MNKQNGNSFSDQLYQAVKATNPSAEKEITLKTSSGIKTRVDIIELTSSGVKITEAKSSLTAKLTPNQKAAFPEILLSGATVAGKGKGYLQMDSRLVTQLQLL